MSKVLPDLTDIIWFQLYCNPPPEGVQMLWLHILSTILYTANGETTENIFQLIYLTLVLQPVN